jgi:hypothetical protein
LHRQHGSKLVTTTTDQRGRAHTGGDNTPQLSDVFRVGAGPGRRRATMEVLWAVAAFAFLMILLALGAMWKFTAPAAIGDARFSSVVFLPFFVLLLLVLQRRLTT